MAEDLMISGTSKAEMYESLLPQLKALIGDEKDEVANMANITAALKEAFSFLWVGFYLVKEDELVLGPFQGPIACTRIQKGKGVCGEAWSTQKNMLVPDVDAFPGHIACSSMSRSEVVIPIISDGKGLGVLDVDSIVLDDFDETDVHYLEQICQWVSTLIS